MVIKRIGILTPRSGGRGRPPDSRRDGGATNTDLVQMGYVAGAGWHCSLPDAESGKHPDEGNRDYDLDSNHTDVGGG